MADATYLVLLKGPNGVERVKVRSDKEPIWGTGDFAALGKALLPKAAILAIIPEDMVVKPAQPPRETGGF